MNMTGVCNRSLTLTASYTRKPRNERSEYLWKVTEE